MTDWSWSRIPWRCGRKVGRTIYACTSDDPDDHPLIGVMDTPDLAMVAVVAHNAAIPGRGLIP